MKITNIEHENDTILYTLNGAECKLEEVSEFDIIDSWIGVEMIETRSGFEGYLIDGSKYDDLSHYGIEEFMIEDYIKNNHYALRYYKESTQLNTKAIRNAYVSTEHYESGDILNHSKGLMIVNFVNYPVISKIEASVPLHAKGMQEISKREFCEALLLAQKTQREFYKL